MTKRSIKNIGLVKWDQETHCRVIEAPEPINRDLRLIKVAARQASNRHAVVFFTWGKVEHHRPKAKPKSSRAGRRK